VATSSGWRSRALLYLYSWPNILGSLLALGGLALFFLGIINLWWPFIVVGLYLIGVLLAPRSKQFDLRIADQRSADEVRQGLANLQKTIQGRVPADVAAKVQSISASILETLPTGHADAPLDVADPDLYTIRQTALSYLPTALETYMALPTAYATLHPVRDGKTARQILLEQLDLLDTSMRQIADDSHRNETDQLIAHGRFLQEKFGHSELDLDGSFDGTAATPPAPSTPAAPASPAAPEVTPPAAPSSPRKQP
jgi:hypothetical protein